MMMLGVTTSDPKCSLALWRGGEIIAEESFDGMRTCVEVMIPLIEGVLERSGAGLGDIDLLAVDRGPGGLTGIKIGLVTVRTFAQALDRKVVPVSSLHAIAFGASPDERLTAVATHCSATEIYTAIFKNSNGDGGIPERVTEDRLETLESAAEMFCGHGSGGLRLVGGAAPRVNEAAVKLHGIQFDVAPEDAWPPKASSVCRIALATEPIPWRELQANYLCLSNAERAAESRRMAGGKQ
jgi:tRNA threonylcarbamoyl adenosine modification protein YeaZ